MATVAPQEFSLLSALSERQQRVIAAADDADLLASITSNPGQLLRTMADKGLLHRVARGRYVAVGPGGGDAGAQVPPFVLIDAALERRYAISFLSALSRYGLTDHEPYKVTVLIDWRENSSPPSTIGGVEVETRVERRDGRWFGIRTESTHGGTYRIVDPERALIDSLDRPDLAGGPEVVTRALAAGLTNDDLRLSRLIRYATTHSGRVAKRLGFLLETLNLADEEAWEPLLRRAQRTRRYDALFDLENSEDAPNAGKWRLRVEIPSELLRGWALYEHAQ